MKTKTIRVKGDLVYEVTDTQLKGTKFRINSVRLQEGSDKVEVDYELVENPMGIKETDVRLSKHVTSIVMEGLDVLAKWEPIHEKENK